MFWRTSSVILTRFFPRNGPFFRGCSRLYLGCSVVPISTSLPLMPMPSFLCMCCQFWTRWLGSRTRSNTLWTICQCMPSLRLLCSGRCCQEFFFRLGSRWFWWCCCGPRKSGSPTYCPYWSTNHSNLMVQLHLRKFHQGLGTLRLYA